MWKATAYAARWQVHTHFAYCLLITVYWLLITDHWSLITDYWSLITDYWSLITDYCMKSLKRATYFPQRCFAIISVPKFFSTFVSIKNHNPTWTLPLRGAKAKEISLFQRDKDRWWPSRIFFMIGGQETSSARSLPYRSLSRTVEKIRPVCLSIFTIHLYFNLPSLSLSMLWDQIIARTVFYE